MPIRSKPLRVNDAAIRAAVLETLESRTLLSGAVWTVSGDARGKRRNDTIVVALPPDGQLRATINGQPAGTRDASAVSSIEVSAGRGNDTVRVELGGLPVRVFGGP